MTEFIIKNDEGSDNRPRYFYIVDAMVRVYDQEVDIDWSWDIDEAKIYTHEGALNSIKVIEYCLPSIVGQLTIVEVSSTKYDDYDRAMGIIQ